MRALAIASVLVAASAAAMNDGDPQTTYIETSGRFVAGLVAVGVEPVNLARADLVPRLCHATLLVDLDFRPENATASVPGAFVAVPFEFQVELFDAATGERLPGAVLRYTSPGTRTFALGREHGASPLRVDLYLLRGADATWDLRVRGMPDPFLPCGMPPVVNEVEANPAGVDAGNEWVELFNPNVVAVDVSGWTVLAMHGTPAALTLPAASIVAAEGRLVVAFTAGEALDDDAEVVVLEDAAGVEVDRTPALDDAKDDGQTWQRVPEGAWAAGWAFQAGTPGAAN